VTSSLRTTASTAADSPFATRQEAHFGDRVVRCFVDRPGSWPAMFGQAVARHRGRTAMVFGSRRWTWRELDEAVARLAAALAGRGIGRGDRVCLLLSNRPEFVLVLHATQRLGAIAVPVSVREQAPGLAYILGHCGAKAVVHDDDLVDRLPAEGPAAEALATATPAGEAPPRVELRVAASQLASMAAAVHSPCFEAAPVAEEDTAVILYTSGTTGRPKGAMLSHFNIVHSAIHYEDAMRLTAADVSAMAVPASHVTGLIAMIAGMLRVGGSLVVVPAFKAGDFLALAARERITHTILVPAMYNLCLLQPDFDAHDLSAWRIGCYGGAPMPESTITALAAKLPGMTLMNAYGSTETTSPATVMPIGEQAAHLDSVGRPVRCADIVVVDDEGREVAPGEPGEILVGGPMVVRGYWDNPQATDQSFVGGYWRSGDIGSKDAEGYVRVFDRKKDMINRGGYKIWSIEVENALMAHDAVIEAAVVGVPCPVLGERVHAFVFTGTKSGSDHNFLPGNCDLTPISSALTAWCAARLADYKVPERIVVCDEPLPRNANGKLLKRALRERA
jgi:long-chain acyl-CoA synthetase